MKFLKTINIFFQNDLRIKLSYKFSFVFDFIFIVIKIFILYFISQFIEIDNNNMNIGTDYFTFAVFGLCLVEALISITNSSPKQIEELKKTGVLEEMIQLPISDYLIILGCNIYQVFFSLYKILIVLVLGSIFSKSILIEFSFILHLFLTLLFFISSLIFLSLISSSLSILFSRSRIFPVTFVFLSIIFGGVYFPEQLIYGHLYFISYVLPIEPSLDILRMLTDKKFNLSEFYENIFHLILLTIFYGILSSVSLKKSIRYAKKNGSLLFY